MHIRFRLLLGMLVCVAGSIGSPLRLRADYDHTRYMGPEELRAGMKGYGRTVMSGAKIETFQFEVVSVMRNAYYARQDVILVRCTGLNLEHSGIIGGMSGSPCYIRDDKGNDRMIGAIAYGWTFNKDPLAGVQPITQMLPIAQVRAPQPGSGGEKKAPTASADPKSAGGRGIDLGEHIASLAPEEVDKTSRFSVFNDQIRKALASRPAETTERAGLRPLLTPVMVSGVSDRGMARLGRYFEKYGLTPVASGGVGEGVVDVDSVKLEPGSALTIPFVTGDIMMEGLGTCTWTDGDRVLGFGHSMFGEGSVELPLATGVVHTVISSVMRSNKVGAALKTVGTLYGDENSGIFGVTGPAPAPIPVEVVVRDIRGEQTFKFMLVQEQFFTPMLLGSSIMESVLSHSDPPKEHTIRYALETEFKDHGTFRTSNFTSMGGVGGLGQDAMLSTMGMLNAPFGKAKVVRARAEVTIEKGAKLAQIDQCTLPRSRFKPGETVVVRMRWRHYMSEPLYSTADYELKLPEDLPDGEYDLMVGSSNANLMAIRQERPYLFQVDSLQRMLKAYNLMASFPDNRLYLRLSLPTGGLAVRDVEMPELPSYRRQVLLASGRTDVTRFSDALAVAHETPFAVEGSRALKIRVSRRSDQ